MRTWLSVRLTAAQVHFLLAHIPARSPSEALRIALKAYFASRGLQFPDTEMTWGGQRLSQK